MAEELKKDFKKLRFFDENGEEFPEWEEKKFDDTFKSLPNKSYQIESSQVKDEGSIPVIDQGKQFITGYSDDIKKVFPRNKKPLVVYGDHTTAIKYIDFDFMLGGDGTKVLDIQNQNDSTLFAYYSLCINNPEPEGYKRHFSILRKKSLSFPSLPEQIKIAEFLSKIDEKIEAQSKLVELLKKQKQGYSQRLFNGSLRFKKDDGTDYDDWEEKKLGELEEDRILVLGRGKVISKNDILSKPGIYPIYSSSSLNNGKMGEYGQYMFDDERITWSVDGGGKFFYRDQHKYSITNVSGWIKVAENNLLNTKFLYYHLDFLWDYETFDYSHKAHPSVIKNIYTLLLPSLPEQEKIAAFLSSLDNRIDEQLNKIEQLKQEKQAYMQRVLV